MCRSAHLDTVHVTERAAPPPPVVVWGASMGIAQALALPHSGARAETLPRSIRIALRSVGAGVPSLLLLENVGCPVGLHVDGIGRVHFSTTDHAIARVNDLQGIGLLRYGDEGSKAGQFKSPWGIVADAGGRIYIADTENHRIVRVDGMDGGGWTAFGRQGAGVGEFSSPAGLALDARGRLYVADSGNQRIVRVDDITGAGWEDFHPYAVLAGLPQYRPGMDTQVKPAGLAIDQRGRIYFTDLNLYRIVRIDDMTGAGIVVLGRAGGGVGEFRRPFGVAVDRGGRIYVADQENHRVVQVRDMSGRGWAALGTQGSDRGQFNSPTAVAVDLIGRIYVSDFMNDRIVRIDAMTGAGWMVLDTSTGRSGS